MTDGERTKAEGGGLEQTPEARGEKLAIVVGLAALFFGGYFGIPRLHDPANVVSLETALDRALPYVPAAGFAYALCYAQVFLPALLVPDHALFRRGALALAIVMVASFACFLLFPVHVPYPPLTGRAGEWILEKNLLLDDRGFNAFPSLHVSLAVVAALSIHHARPALRAPIWLSTTAIAVSTVLVKRHWWLDVPAGALLGWAVHRVVLTPSLLARRDARGTGPETP